MMNKIKIPYHQTGYFSKLISLYLEDGNNSSDRSKLSNELKPFYNHYCNIDSFAKMIEERKSLPIKRAILVEALTQQYSKIEISAATKSNIQNLNNKNCFTVTTGHQLNLFTGPLYFIYKIVSTINLVKELKVNYPTKDFVPVFWMASEDHDFEEINHFNLFKKRYELIKPQSGAVGQMKLKGVEELFSELTTDLGDRNGVKEILELFSKFYISSNTYTEAIRGIINHLFGKYGLVIIDGNDIQLKQLMIKEFEIELLERKNHILINQTSEKLKTLGFKPQITPREINLFYLQEGSRERIIFENNNYKVLNTELQFSEAEIIQKLNNHPEQFSPNAPMRCMYQEKILPNLAYIGGGGELAYWFQLKAMFNANTISFPTLILRNSTLFIDKGSSKRISKLGLEVTDLFKDTQLLIKEYLKNTSEFSLELNNEEKTIKTVFEEIVKQAKNIDASLQGMIKAELQKCLKSIKNIENRLIKAEKQKEEVSVNQIKKLKDKLFPNNSLQERHDNLISLLLFYEEDVIEELIANLHPLDKQFTILMVN